MTDGAENVDPVRPLEATFTEDVDPSAEVIVRECEDAETGSGDPLLGQVVVDGRTVRFLPEIFLRYGTCYKARFIASDAGGNPVEKEIEFTTFDARVLARIDVDAQDVVIIPSESVGAEDPASRFIALAVGDGDLDADQTQEATSGLLIYDVVDLTKPLKPLREIKTAGFDRALHFVDVTPGTADVALETVGTNGGQFSGPFLLSVDGAGGPDRFGMLRIYDLSNFPMETAVASRFLNLSANEFSSLSGGPFVSPGQHDLATLLLRVPNDVGIPLDVTSLGMDVIYVANAPHIGLEAVLPNGMNTDILGERQVDGFLRGDLDPTTNRDRSFPIRAVEILSDLDFPERSVVIAVSQQGADNALLLVDPRLSEGDEARTPLVRDVFSLGARGRPQTVAVLPRWPVFDRKTQTTTLLDLAVVMSEGIGLRVLPVAEDKQRFDLGLMDGAEAALATKGMSPQAAIADPDTRQLLVADGTAGLTIMDFRSPGGQIDRNGDGVDDRVIATIPLTVESEKRVAAGWAASARRVAFYRDSAGRRIAAVAAGEAGLFLVQVGPALLEFDRLWEADNFANHVVNDAPQCEEEDARVRPEALFVVPEVGAAQTDLGCTTPNSYCLKLQLTVDPSVTSPVLWSIVDLTQVAEPEAGVPPLEADGVEIASGVVTRDGKPTVIEFADSGRTIECFKNKGLSTSLSGSIANVLFEDHKCAWYALRFGIDRSGAGQGSLDFEEWKPFFAIDPLTGGIVRPHIAGLSLARYSETLGRVQFLARQGLFFSLARNFLRIFVDGELEQVEAGYKPQGSLAPIDFNYRDDLFASWLTHKAGAPFGPQGESANVVHYVWESESVPSVMVAESNEIRCETKRVFDAEIAGRVPLESGTISSAEPNEADQIDKEGCPLFLKFEEGDLNFTLARVRLLHHRVEVDVARDADNNSVVQRVMSFGELEDLYDFSYAAPGPAPNTAALQIGHGDHQPQGVIFRSTIRFEKEWDGLPDWGDCP